MSPKFVVAESPDLAHALSLAGFDLLTGKTEAREVADAIRNSQLGQRELLVVTPAHTPLLVAWVQSLVASNRLVAVIGNNVPIPKTAQVKLPCSVNDILSVFRAPQSSPYGEWIVNPDFTVTRSGEDEPTADSLFDALAGDWDDEPGEPAAPPHQRYADDFDDAPVPVPQPKRVDPSPLPTSQPTPPPARPVAPTIPQVPVQRPPEPAVHAPRPTIPAYPPAPHAEAAESAEAVRPVVTPSVPTMPVAPAIPRPQVPYGAAPAEPSPSSPFSPQGRPASPYSPVVEPAPDRFPPKPEPAPWRPAPMVGPGPQSPSDLPPIMGQARPEPAEQFTGGPSSPSGSAPVILVAAAKGGVGKSSFTITLAESAAAGGVRKVILVDGNRGQGDVHKYLRTSRPLPSIYDAAVQDNLLGAIIRPQMLNEARDSRLPPLHFGMVMAPRAGQVNSSIVTSDVYGQVVEEAREFADLVIIDTQITEEEDTSGLWDEVWLPLIRSGAWCVGLSSDSTPAVKNLQERLGQWVVDRVPMDRVMLVMNDVSAETMLDIDQIVGMLSRDAPVVGTVPRLDEVKQAFQVGRVPVEVPQVREAMHAILYRVTGYPGFAPEPPVEERGGFLASLFGRGRR